MNEDRSVRYHRLKRRASAASLAWTVALLAGLSATSATVWLRSTVQAVAGEPASSGPSSLLIVALYVVNRGPISLTQVLALAVPTGFAIEIFSFLGFSALELKPAYTWVPLLWCGAAIAIRITRDEWPVRVRLSETDGVDEVQLYAGTDGVAAHTNGAAERRVVA